MTQRARPRAILLDFFGTLIEEDGPPMEQISRIVAAASPQPVTWQEVYATWYDAFDQMCLASFGPTFRTQREIDILSLQGVIERCQAKVDAAALCQIAFDYWLRPALFPEVRPVLSHCHLPICIVSNIDTADLQAALVYHNLHFDHIVTSEDCRAYKPRAEVFAAALSLLGAEPGEALHVGDSLRCDVAGAKALGIPVLWLNRGGRALPEGHVAPDYVAPDLTGLLEVLSDLRDL